MNRRQLRATSGIGAILTLAAIISSCNVGGDSITERPTAPTVPTAGVEKSPAAAGELGRASTVSAAQSIPNSPFWDDAIQDALEKRRAHIARIEALVRFHGMPEEDIEALLAQKEEHFAEEMEWFRRMKERYPF